jgi:ABC-2 type transport system permease protein
MINAFRYGMLGNADVNIVTALSFIIICNMILFFIALQLLTKGVGLKA